MSFGTIPLRRFVLSACDGPFGSAITSDHYSDEGARVIRLGNIGQADWLDHDKAFLPVDYWRTLSRHHALAEDLIVGALGDESHPVGRACVLPDVGLALVKADCFRLRIDRSVADPRFLALYLCSSWGLHASERMSEGSTRPRLTLSKVLSLPVPDATVTAQRAIADYLDAETARIDALTEKKRRMIELLEERFTELTAIAVTQGVVASERSPGGPAWLANMPATWRTYPLGRLVAMVSGGTPSRDTERFWSGEVPWVSPKDMKRLQLSDTEDHISDEAVKVAGLKVLPVGTVLVVVRGMILAHSFPVAVTGRAMTINQDMKALRAGPGLRPDFLAYLLMGMKSVMLSFVEEAAHGTRRLATEVWSRVPVGLPPLDEQAAIVASLETAANTKRSISSRLAEQIERLLERRQALITAAVAGDLPIPGVAA